MDALCAISPTSLGLCELTYKPAPHLYLYAFFCSSTVRVQGPKSQYRSNIHPRTKIALLPGKQSEECSRRHRPSDRAKPGKLEHCRHKTLIIGFKGRRARPRPRPSPATTRQL